MPRKPEKLPLVGLTEIARHAGVQKAAVSMWRTRYEDFPDSVADLAAGSIFWWPQVESWLWATGRRTDANLTRAEVNRYQRDREFPRKKQGGKK